MLVICYTNHALDQFLEGLLPVTNNLLRVGSQSKNEELQKYNLTQRRKAVDVGVPPAVFQMKRQVNELITVVKSLDETLNLIEANESIVSFDGFKSLVQGYKDSWFDIAKNAQIKAWLMEGKCGEPLHVSRQREAIRVSVTYDVLTIIYRINLGCQGSGKFKR